MHDLAIEAAHAASCIGLTCGANLLQAAFKND
jgi:hypothetical protein